MASEIKIPLRCGVGSFFQPLVPTFENAFNPCFLAFVFIPFAFVSGFAAFTQLVVYRSKKSYGSVAAKSTGLTHWARCALVTLNTLIFVALTSRVSIHERFADHKLLAFGSVTAVLVFLITPLHFIETTRAPLPNGVLLCFWPVFTLLEAALWYQDSFTNWPLFLSNSAPTLLAVAVVLSLTIFFFEYSDRLWTPSHELLIHYHQSEELTALLSEPNVVQKFTFTWMNPLIVNSFVNQTVSNQDLPKAPSNMATKKFTEQLEKYWSAPKKQKSRRHLIISLIKAFGPAAVVSFMFEASDSLLNFVQPQLLRLLIVFVADKIEDPRIPVLKGVLISLGMFLTTLAQTALNNQYVLKVLEVGLGCRSSLTSLIFKKSLRLSNQARAERSTGDIVNLISIDATRVQTCAQEISTVIIAPTELVLCIWSLWSLLGRATFAGVAAIIIVIPLNVAIVRILKRFNRVQMTLKDERNRITNEIFVSMKSIKFYSWEIPMLKRLLEARNDKELKNLRKIRAINQVGNLIWTTMPFLVAFSTFATFATTERTPLTSEIVFPALALLNILSRPMLQLPFVINYITEASVALDRISSFLLAPEIDENLLSIQSNEEEQALELKNISFLWNKLDVEEITEDMDFSGYKYALKNINIVAKKGDFICVVGRVGSGKSSLLSSIIGQLEAVDAEKPHKRPFPIQLGGTIAYCSQNPWIMNSTVRDNITFGFKYDEEYYNKTIEACQLLPDLKVLPDGDGTQVGEKGITLSGGQKARLSLARAVYARADIYLFDDILSAVDSHVGKSIIAEVLGKKGLLSTKTIVLATNNILVLEGADKIYLIEHGKISEEALYRDIQGSDKYPKLNELISEFGHGNSRDPSASPMPEETPDLEMTEVEDTHSPAERRSSLASFDWDPMKKNLPNRTGQIAEVSAKGKVKWDVYYSYIKACSVVGVSVWVVFSIATTLGSVTGNYWLKKWAERNSDIGDNSDALRFISIYALVGFTTSILNLGKGILFWVFLGIRGGRNVHEDMARRILKAPMLFFDRTPVGRIMNRFSNDINKVDDALPRSFNMLMSTILKTIMTIIVVGYALPAFLVVVAFLAVIYGYYQKYYVSVQRELKRLVSISRSPIFAHFQESLTGVDTIRAYRQSDRFEYMNNANVDFNLRSLFMLRSINRWLSVRLQFMGSLVIWTSSSLLIYKTTTSSPISAGMAGFVMSYALLVTDLLKMMVRMSAEVEANIVSVERCLEYTKLPMEEDENNSLIVQPPTSWPQHGKIVLDDYSTRYAQNLDLVLRNVSLSIASGEKIGVVGRTGAGKSSLVLAIFRMIPAALGHIEIDDLDTLKMKLFDLRHNLSIIPQDSHLFDGNIRQNLDPFGEHSDEMLWRVLEHSNLKESIEKLDEGLGLDSKVSEGGSNFSVGQRQLMCLGRALLNPSKVLVLDEATAAVDVQTDKIIQATIRREFKDKTIITIAHRLDTVMDSDRILSLDHGKVVEFDSPQKLLQNPDSIFYNLCKQGSYI